MIRALTVLIGPTTVTCPYCRGTAPSADAGRFLLDHVACNPSQHPRACYDDEGKLECVCGLDEARPDAGEPF